MTDTDKPMKLEHHCYVRMIANWPLVYEFSQEGSFDMEEFARGCWAMAKVATRVVDEDRPAPAESA